MTFMRHFGSIVTRRKARKHYRCEDPHCDWEGHGCTGTINPGETYTLSVLPPNDPEIGNTGWWRSRCHEEIV